ncbi:MFS transporter [Nocardioides sp. Root151]|uniref:MFS transporter n=1 Tax=Nocardioides sp. Root151 TaxID=1736475 RepID=UPI0007025C17|nr:MFS transporter [Nocardioides sp. Root151]KQZ75197.1 multidrug DMT transporter permease [Nocardioides sp. Root151]
MALHVTEGAVITEPSAAPVAARAGRAFPFLVFLLTFGLLLSDYMSRQVLSAVFPLLKAEWGLTDTQLGGLTSVVALAVGILAVPLSIIGDRFGRVRAIIAMGALWSVATLGCALAAGYGQMMLARLFVGVGEAAFGSVGLAVVIAVYPARRRSALTGSFMAGGLFGAVLGVALGGIVAERLGWRSAFVAMAIFGFVLVALYRLLVTDEKLEQHRHPDSTPTAATPARPRFRSLFSTPSVVLAYLGSGTQLFVAGSVYAWLPSYLNREYDLAPDRAAVAAAGYILVMGVGMIVCGAVTDRVAKTVPIRKWTSAICYAVVSLVLLGLAFAQPAGTLQLVLLGFGVFFCSGTAGPAGAMVANLTPERIRATAFGTLTMANNLLGLAAGPLVMGMLADQYGLATAFRALPVAGALSIVLLLVGRAYYPASLARVHAAELEVRA